MPLRQIRKHPKSRSSRSSRKHRSSHQRGGDPGRVALPPSYFGNGTSGYFADGSTELNRCARQNSVSQGSISSNGKWAGPNLYPMLGGRRKGSSRRRSLKAQHQVGGSCGSCGCSGRRNFQSKTMKGGFVNTKPSTY
jgi:hypothetical protein